eukprot:GILK01009632.1.p1 GENE.GILK01009632.1~~GILK01009632.1.p1  ORF type:complete len:233 (+),score=15.71 GILK01009632.1:45-743(+)
MDLLGLHQKIMAFLMRAHIISPQKRLHPAFGWVALVVSITFVYFMTMRRQRRQPARLHTNPTPPQAEQLPDRNRTNATRSSSSSSGASRRKLSVATNGILVRISEKGVCLVDEAVPALLQLCQGFDIYLVTQCNTDQEEQQVLSLLGQTSAFELGLERHKVMFCSTAAGRGSMIRQLSPFTHVEVNEAVVSSLKPHVRRIIFVGNEQTTDTSVSDVPVKRSLQEVAAALGFS